jgi:hypothetical protein
MRKYSLLKCLPVSGHSHRPPQERLLLVPLVGSSRMGFRLHLAGDLPNSRLKARVNAGVDPKPALSATNLIARSLWASESAATRRRYCVRYCIGDMPVHRTKWSANAVREIPTALASVSNDQFAPG